MKLFEQLKSNASRMAVYAILGQRLYAESRHPSMRSTERKAMSNPRTWLRRLKTGTKPSLETRFT